MVRSADYRGSAFRYPGAREGLWAKLQAGKPTTKVALPPRAAGMDDEIVVGGRKRAIGIRAPMIVPMAPNDRWSLDFVSDLYLY